MSTLQVQMNLSIPLYQPSVFTATGHFLDPKIMKKPSRCHPETARFNNVERSNISNSLNIREDLSSCLQSFANEIYNKVTIFPCTISSNSLEQKLDRANLLRMAIGETTDE